MKRMNGMTEEPRIMIIRQKYKESRIMYIRQDGEVETRLNGQKKKVGGSRSAFSNMNENVGYG